MIKEADGVFSIRFFYLRNTPDQQAAGQMPAAFTPDCWTRFPRPLMQSFFAASKAFYF